MAPKKPNSDAASNDLGFSMFHALREAALNPSASCRESMKTRAKSIASLVTTTKLERKGIKWMREGAKRIVNEGQSAGYDYGFWKGVEAGNVLIPRIRALLKLATDISRERREGLRSKPDALLDALVVEADAISALNVMDHIGEQDR